MQVMEAVARALVERGVEHVFGVVGSGNFGITNALCAAGARYVAARHECAAVCMADGYARASGRPGIVTVHQGPGMSNAATGLAEAAKSRTPLLLLAADTSTGAVQSNFRIDQEGLARSLDAVAERLHTPGSALADLDRAWRRALEGRHAVALMLPLDVQTAEAPAGFAPPESTAVSSPAPSEAATAAIADLVEASSRPAIVAGRGAVLSEAGARLEVLGDRIGAILATSANGNGLFSGLPYAVGISGGFAPPVGAGLLADADLVLAFGASLNMWTTRHGTLIGPETRLVQVDIDPAAIGRQRPVDLGVVADASLAAGALEAELERRGYRSRGYRTPDLARRIAGGRWRDEPFEDASTDRTIDPRTLTLSLDDLLPDERTVAVDSGHFMGWPAMYLSVPDPAGFIFNQSYQSIGLGLGAAIGAAVARPDRLTVAALGDGGAFMALGELETAARLGLRMLILIYDDAAYGAEVHHFGPRGDPLDIVRFPDTDFAALGRAAGAGGVTVRTLTDLSAVEDWLEAPDGPLVVDAKVNPTVVAEWLEDAFRAH
ncbi:MAG TPA: thiamine pyrophosphate-binding protein [Gemmatimonadota bacterium]|nr:thiamine pyrophosphate-binding protein [Gemmatimonadota bacterium]